jgi:CheY-like chemotaxis protein
MSASTAIAIGRIAANKQRLSDIRHRGRNFFWRQGLVTQSNPTQSPRLRFMKTLRILIVEDEPLVAMNLEVTEIVTAIVVVEPSVAATMKVLHEALEFAFLDVNVTNGKTIEVAQILERKHMPFVFVSGSPQEELPFDLRSAPFIPKPFYPAQIKRVLQAIVD